MDNDKILEIIISAIPYPDQIKNFDTSGENGVYFSWRGEEIRVNKNLKVDIVEGNIYSHNNFSIVLEVILKNRLHEMPCTKGK